MMAGDKSIEQSATALYPPGFTPNSAVGQHILLDPTIIDRTAELLPEGQRCIEIGAGPGTLTQALLKRGGDVVAYEVDRRCEPSLEALRKLGRLQVHWQNFLEAPTKDLDAIQPFHIFGNIPFHISEPLMMKLTDVRFASCVLLVGKNLVQAMTAPNPGHDTWSRLSLVTRGYFNVERIVDVPRSSFDPPPRVDAGVVRLTRQDVDSSWRSDAVSRSYRALVEAGSTNSTAAKALKTVVVTPRGDAETTGGKRAANRQANRRNERRRDRRELSGIRSEYNIGRLSERAGNDNMTSEDMLRIVSATVDERVLSKPLSGLSNQDLRKICSAITTAINRRKKQH